MELRWITPKQCSSYLSIHLKTVYSQIERGEIPATKIGGSVRIDRKKLDDILESREKVPIEKKIDEWGI